MIFPENLSEQDKAQSALTNSQQQSQPLYQAPPPTYGSSSYYPTAGYSGPNVVFYREDQLRKRRGRFILLAGVFVLVLIGFSRGTFSWHGGDGDDEKWRANPEDYPIPDNVELNHCIERNDWSNIHNHPSLVFPYTAEAHFDLPLNSDALFFIERGDLSGGTSTVTTDSQLKDDQVHVKVVIHYRHDFVRDWAKVCQATRGVNEHGVGIFTPHFTSRRASDHRLSFDITISLPQSTSEHVIKKFETELHNTRQHVKTLHNFAFDLIDLQGTNGGIVVDDLYSTKGFIRTTNGHISGAFNTTNSLTIKTSNARVDVEVGAVATNAVTPQVVVSSTNGELQAGFTLTSESGKGGEFDISASTTNSKIDIEFPVQPLDSVLRFKGTSSNGQAKLSLNPAFEGKFEAHTTNGQANVKVDTAVSDPSGRSRKRDVSIKQIKNRDIYGSAYWSDNRDIEGKALLRTSNGRLTLLL